MRKELSGFRTKFYGLCYLVTLAVSYVSQLGGHDQHAVIKGLSIERLLSMNRLYNQSSPRNTVASNQTLCLIPYERLTKGSELEQTNKLSMRPLFWVVFSLHT
jgi:hypothetical protein